MKIAVYDTYAQSKNGHVIHFDVFVKEGTSNDLAFEFAQKFLKEIGEEENALKQSQCNFCHTEQANPTIQQQLQENGYAILQMEGCPKPIL
jgi:hypothetical protein